MQPLICLITMATIVILVTAEYDDDFCKKRIGVVDNSTNEAWIRPNFYDNFYVFIEVKLPENLTTLYVDEYYSQQSQMMYGTVRGKVNQSQFWVDASTDEIMMGPTTTSVCVDSKLDSSQIGQYLGVTIDREGDVQLNTPEVAFGWHEKYQRMSKYLGGATLPDRGIQTVKWQVCSFNPETQITAVTEWYIVDPSTILLPVVSQTDTDKKVLPMLADIQAINKTDPKNPQEFQLRIDFSFYDKIQPNSSVFQIPTTMICQAKPSAQVPLPQAPSYFRFRGEQMTINSPNSQSPSPPDIVYTVERYMKSMNMFVQDIYTQPDNPNTGNEISVSRKVDDYNLGLTFYADLITGECYANDIVSDNVDAISIGNGLVKMRSSQQFFDLDYKNYQYMGIHKMRGIDCDSWSAYFKDNQTDHEQNALYTWYFATPLWLKNNGYSNWTNPLPVALEIQQDGSYVQFNIYEFDTLDGMETPDVSLCFEPEYTLNIEMYIAASYDTITYLTVESVRRAFYNALIKQTSLKSLLRVSRLYLQPAVHNETMVRFKLFDLRPLHVTGDVPTAQPGVPNQQIFDELTRAINSGTFSIKIVDDFGATYATLSVRRNSLGLFKDGKYVPGGSKNGSTGHSPGAMAGIGIGMLVVGIILGIAVIFAVKRIRMSQGDKPSDLKTLEESDT